MKNKIIAIVSEIEGIGRWGIIAFTQLFFISSVHAQAGVDVSNTDKLISNVICPIFNAMFAILMAVAVIMIIWAAYLYVFAQEDVERTSKARRTITYAAVAVIVALIARGFPLLIGSIVTTNTSGLNACGSVRV